MGFFDWLMKGVGFETDEDQLPKVKKQKQKKDKKLKKNAMVEEPLPQKQPYSYDGFGGNDFDNIQSLSANKGQDGDNDNSVSGGFTYGSNQTGFSGGFDSFGADSNSGGYGTKNVVIHHPKTYKEVQGLIDYLKQGESAIIILDGLSDAEAQRILDYVSGAVYALSGSVKRVDGNIFLLTPEGFNIVHS